MACHRIGQARAISARHRPRRLETMTGCSRAPEVEAAAVLAGEMQMPLQGSWLAGPEMSLATPGA